MKNMKKVLFLLLFLLVLGTTGTNAQVRIGGDGEPHTSAVLDLNATDAINNGTKGLALPRVELADFTANLDGTTANIDGMMVYNTSGDLSAGVYYWDGGYWVKVSDGSFLIGGPGDEAPKSGSTLSFNGTKWTFVGRDTIVSASTWIEINIGSWNNGWYTTVAPKVTGCKLRWLSATHYGPFTCNYFSSWVYCRATGGAWLNANNAVGYDEFCLKGV